MTIDKSILAIFNSIQVDPHLDELEQAMQCEVREIMAKLREEPGTEKPAPNDTAARYANK